MDDEQVLNAVIDSVKNLPVNVSCFDDADRWVGTVLALQNLRINWKLTEEENASKE